MAVKVRDSAFVTVSRQRTLARADRRDRGHLPGRAASWHGPQLRGIKVRLLGVAASHLEEGQQLALFDEADDRRRRATEAADEIRRRFGSRAIRRARLLESGVAEPFERDPMRSPDDGSIGRARGDDTARRS